MCPPIQSKDIYNKSIKVQIKLYLLKQINVMCVFLQFRR